LLPLTSDDTLSEDTNNASIVAKLTYHGTNLLLTGDPELWRIIWVSLWVSVLAIALMAPRLTLSGLLMSNPAP